MKKKWIIAVAVLAIVATVALLVHRSAQAREATTYRFTTVERGDVESTVSATGTLSAVTTVAVGTQVSGQLSQLLVDFNDTVKKGQLLARVDPKLQQQAVTDAQASVARARAQYQQAQREHSRNAELSSAGLIARSEVETTSSSLAVARANVTSAQVELDRARQNLEYTNIYAPIDGVVVERNIDLGQTVAASLSAPQLFLIAEDLTNMQILASVGEGDIASIKEGQRVKFTVQAIQGQTFEGTVRQVRLQSATNENVVNYTVVVAVSNPEKKLLPGMTARVEFLTSSAENVLKVANAALRFKPAEGEAVVTTTSERPARSRTPGTEAGAGTSAGAQGGGGTERRAGGKRRAGGAAGMGTLYTVDADGRLTAVRVRTGLSDGSMTEVRGPEVKEGMKIVAGTATKNAEAQTPNSPFGGGQQQQGGPRRPGGF
jgi:HlyD family secretion protein